MRIIMKKHKSPIPTVDIIIEITRRNGQEGIILIKRKNPPHGWALPGGFVDRGESLEEAAVREAKEETSLDIRLTSQFHTYSDPKRDPRQHTISTVYVATAQEGRKLRTMPRISGYSPRRKSIFLLPSTIKRY